MNNFSPFKIYLSPLRTAVVLKAVKSDPAHGSVSAKADSALPLASNEAIALFVRRYQNSAPDRQRRYNVHRTQTGCGGVNHGNLTEEVHELTNGGTFASILLGYQHTQ